MDEDTAAAAKTRRPRWPLVAAVLASLALLLFLPVFSLSPATVDSGMSFGDNWLTWEAPGGFPAFRAGESTSVRWQKDGKTISEDQADALGEGYGFMAIPGMMDYGGVRWANARVRFNLACTSVTISLD